MSNQANTNSINNTEAHNFELTEELIAEMKAHNKEFVIARDKFIAGEISEDELGNCINLEYWKSGYLTSAKKQLEEALEKLHFQDIRYTRNGCLTTEDRLDSVTPHQLTMLIYTHLDCPYIQMVLVKRSHGRVRYNIHLLDIKTIFAQVKAENESRDEPITEDVELKLIERDTSEADLNMGQTYMYVFDAFMEVYGVYPEELVNHEDYVRLGRMMNLAIAGECFDI